MVKRMDIICLLSLLALCTLEGVTPAKVTTSGKSVAKGGGTTAVSRVSAVVNGSGSASATLVTEATDGGSAKGDVVVISEDGADVSFDGKATAVDDGAVAIVDAIVRAEGDVDLKSGAFATAIQKGEGPVIAKALLRAKAEGGDELIGEATNGLAFAFATAIGDAPENAATVATTIATAILEEGESRKLIGRSLSVLIVEQGCEPIQDVIQKAEAEVSSKGEQNAFLEAITVNEKLITCTFPDTCGVSGNDKRGECCGNGEAMESGKCGACKDGRCDYRLIWSFPNDIWTCDLAKCKNLKPCICG